MFCRMWYLLYSQVHNERNVNVIMAGCIAAIFPLPLLYLTSPSCSSTLISCKRRKFRQFGHQYGLLHISYCACAKRPYFHVRFTLRRGNVGNTAINKGYIAYFYCVFAKRPYFHFRLKIRRHRRVHRLRFP